ncbi:hypothetical protein GQ602_000033 [Ophiocordyceps camponoti-floridani]|uniref:Uncharacterized protein n=1 Tax=Ophiocordyceps camponoti-floridani TaxID=2030778 RepID=A0A8H4VG19_9HYPO|nr:hypothetical protein GQ602_000033 [Ophiocordyceps camponoti-floridani]
MKSILISVALMATAALATPIRAKPIFKAPGHGLGSEASGGNGSGAVPKRVKFATDLAVSSDLREHRGRYSGPVKSSSTSAAPTTPLPKLSTKMTSQSLAELPGSAPTTTRMKQRGGFSYPSQKTSFTPLTGWETSSHQRLLRAQAGLRALATGQAYRRPGYGSQGWGPWAAASGMGRRPW